MSLTVLITNNSYVVAWTWNFTCCISA